jgi:anti-sigma B factor antagonist
MARIITDCTAAKWLADAALQQSRPQKDTISVTIIDRTRTPSGPAEGKIHSMSLKIAVRETADATILELSGRITLGEGLGELRDSIREALSGARKHLILNLANVSYIDSSGLGQLIGSYATVTDRGGQMKLVSLQKKVVDLMQITKLLTVFETYDSEAAALASFTKA